MRLFLAVAVLVLALVAYTEAQDATFQEHVTKIGQQLTEAGKNFAERAHGVIEDIGNSEVVVSGRNWLSGVVDKMRERFANTQ
ncbi:apolipoprotein C-I [Halichoeres trimaculatus]|uniref:apolipoprotein C-I n=1 Tax=Halichoeres trimaculatus TaxID=147232 RepID=UPI003D9DD3CA